MEFMDKHDKLKCDLISHYTLFYSDPDKNS